MKTCSLLPSARVLWLIVVLLAGMVASRAQSAAKPAADESKMSKTPAAATAKPSKSAADTAEAKAKVVTTGSRIPRKVSRHRSVAETFSPIYVIDQVQIQQSGAATLSGVLRKTLPSAR